MLHYSPGQSNLQVATEERKYRDRMLSPYILVFCVIQIKLYDASIEIFEFEGGPGKR